jgi:group I intron endonuclease
MKIKCRNCNELTDYFHKGLCENCFKLQDINKIDFCGIYKITNMVNNKVYIGQSKNIYKRWDEHRHTLNINKHKNQHLQNAWNINGEDNFMFEILEICEFDLLDNIEKIYINTYHSMDRDYGYNKESGGNRGKTKSIESCLKIGIARKDKYSGENHPLFGKPRSEETKLKLKIANTGKIMTTETKNKISKGNKNKKHHDKQSLEEKEKNNLIRKMEREKNRIKRIYKQGEDHPSAKYTNDKIKEIKEMLIFYSGNSNIVAEKLNINVNTIGDIKNLNSWVNIYPEYNEQLKLLKVKKKNNFTEEQLDEIRNQYNQNKIKMKDLAKIYSCSEETIRRVIKYIGFYEKNEVII